jgi:hypothetical protein
MSCHRISRRLGSVRPGVRVTPDCGSELARLGRLRNDPGWKHPECSRCRADVHWWAGPRAPIDPALIDDILQQGTRTAYRGLNDTVKVSAPNLCGKCYVVVDAQTGKHVVTVMVPK